jgi:hypothetical protein
MQRLQAFDIFPHSAAPRPTTHLEINTCSQPLTLIWPAPTGELNPLDATLTKNRGGVKAPAARPAVPGLPLEHKPEVLSVAQAGPDLAPLTDELNPLDATFTKNGGEVNRRCSSRKLHPIPAERKPVLHSACSRREHPRVHAASRPLSNLTRRTFRETMQSLDEVQIWI